MLAHIPPPPFPPRMQIMVVDCRLIFRISLAVLKSCCRLFSTVLYNFCRLNFSCHAKCIVEVMQLSLLKRYCSMKISKISQIPAIHLSCQFCINGKYADSNIVYMLAATKVHCLNCPESKSEPSYTLTCLMRC